MKEILLENQVYLGRNQSYININAEPLFHLRNMRACFPTQTTSSVKINSMFTIISLDDTNLFSFNKSTKFKNVSSLVTMQ